MKKIAHHTYKLTLMTAAVIAGTLLTSLVGYLLYDSFLNPARYSVAADFDQQVELYNEQWATYKDGDEEIKFRFTEMTPADRSIYCEDLCSSMAPMIQSELRYKGETLLGSATFDSGILTLSRQENMGYGLVPYTIELIGVDYEANTGTIVMTKRPYSEVSFDEPFRIVDGAIAVIEPLRTGVAIQFGTCGRDADCIRNSSFFVDGKYVSDVRLGFRDPDAPAELQFASKDGTTYEKNGVKLRLIESDDKTYAKLVFEKSASR